MYPTIPQIESKICTRCRFERQTAHLICPRCGRTLRTETQIRLFGAGVAVFGFINFVTFGISIGAFYRALAGIDAGELEWRASPETILLTLLVFKLLAALAAAAVIGGLWQLLSGVRNFKVYFGLAGGAVLIWLGLTAADFFVR